MNPLLTSFLTGYKTYIVGIAMILYGLGGAILENHSWDKCAQLILEGLGLMGLRAGVTTETQKTRDVAKETAADVRSLS